MPVTAESRPEEGEMRDDLRVRLRTSSPAVAINNPDDRLVGRLL